MGITVTRKLTLAGTVLVALAIIAGLVAHDALELLTATLRVGRTGLPERMVDEVSRGVEQGRVLLMAAGSILVVLVPWAAIVLHRELERRRAAERALASSEARFRAAMEGSHDSFYVLQAVRDAAGVVLDFEFVELNAEAERLLGSTRAEIIGQRLCELVPSNRSNGFFERYVQVMLSGVAVEGEHEIQQGEMNAAWVHDQVVPLGDGVAITSRDVTERHQREDALRALSLMDELTGLYNRRGFLTLAQQQLKLARRGQRELVLLFVDMDDFKEINDRFGHNEGDVALRRTAAILQHTFRDSDIVARLGGDEFVVLASDIAHGTGPLIVERLRAELQLRNERDGYPYRLSFSVGLATFDPERPPEIEELLATADAMLYEQKRHKHEAVGAPS
ncbi:MAG: GGDEF domain-containing protein [Gemmatimonadetes bacterium]|nr:GGDEF domain-containing protein [Gemmatimonadota bacterium]